MLTTTSADGTNVLAADEGRGPVILVVHGGSSDESAWAKVASLLAGRFRVVRVRRRQYRLDIDTGRPVSIAEEAADVVALAALIGEPMVLVGHSSGAVVVLEAMVAAPSRFAGAVLYEPPIVIGPPLGGEALVRAEAAGAAGKPGLAMQIFVRDIVKVPAWQSLLFRAAVGMLPSIRQFAGRQIRDCRALESLGMRLEAYSGINVPVLLLGGDRSPVHLGERLDALGGKLARSERVVMRGQGHGANDDAPGEVARVIEDFAGRVL